MPEGKVLGRIDKTYPDYEGITIEQILENEKKCLV